MKFIILSRLWHDNDIRLVAVNTVGFFTGSMLQIRFLASNTTELIAGNMQNASLIVSMAATVITCIAGATLAIYKIKLIKKELRKQ